jgi:uncharacterized protein YhbP (UPF0306 family)
MSDSNAAAGFDLALLTREVVDSQSTLTLATSAGGEAWAAPVYYVDHGAALYFFSKPDARHVREALSASGRAAGSIHVPAASWRDIRGLQMSGRIEAVGPGLEAARAVRGYLRKYPFTMEFFGEGQTADLESFRDRFKVRLYRFRPDLVYYLDNRIRFGFREKVEAAW